MLACIATCTFVYSPTKSRVQFIFAQGLVPCCDTLDGFMLSIQDSISSLCSSIHYHFSRYLRLILRLCFYRILIPHMGLLGTASSAQALVPMSLIHWEVSCTSPLTRSTFCSSELLSSHSIIHNET